MSTDQSKKLGLAIIGGGTGGLALLRLFHQEEGITIQGVADIRADAAAIKYARSLNILTTTDFKQLIKQEGIDLIVDVTGNPEVRSQIQKEKAPQVELLGGTSAKLMWNFIDLLERKVDKRTEELKEVQSKVLQSEKLASMGQVATSIGHELRNPLGVIKNSVYYLKMKLKEDSKILKHLGIMDREILSSEAIIDELLNFTRTKELETTLTDLHQVIEESLSVAEVPPSIAIEKKFAPQLPPFQIDGKQIRRVFINLTLNAFQAMEGGGKLKITTSNKGDWTEVVFTDTGKGISPENIEKIFLPFFTTKAKGIGLGLTVTKKIIEQHDGKLNVTSELGRGSTFTVSLPIKT